MPAQKLSPPEWPDGFKNSKLVSLYAQELYWLAHRIDARCELLFAKHPQHPTNFYTAADVTALELAFDALADAAKLRELLVPGRDKLIYRQRAEHLRAMLGSVDYSALIDKKVRNTLEHFPEYLDDINNIHSVIPPKVLYAVAFNCVFSHLFPTTDLPFPFPTFVSPINGFAVFPIRCYVASTRAVHNFFWSIDLGAVADQAKQVKAKIAETLEAKRPEDWVSGFITIGPTGALYLPNDRS